MREEISFESFQGNSKTSALMPSIEDTALNTIVHPYLRISPATPTLFIGCGLLRDNPKYHPSARVLSL